MNCLWKLCHLGRLSTDLADIWWTLDRYLVLKSIKVLANSAHRRQRKGVSDTIFEGKKHRPKIKGRTLVMRETNNAWTWEPTSLSTPRETIWGTRRGWTSGGKWGRGGKGPSSPKMLSQSFSAHNYVACLNLARERNRKAAEAVKSHRGLGHLNFGKWETAEWENLIDMGAGNTALILLILTHISATTVFE